MSSASNGAEGHVADDRSMYPADDALDQHAARDTNRRVDEDDNDSNDDDGSSVSPSILDDISSCPDYNENQLLRKYNKLKAENDELEQLLEESSAECKKKDEEINTLSKMTEKLDAEIRRLKGTRETIEPWSHKLRKHLSGNATGPSYANIYRESCKQENMSQKLTVFHPDFCLRNEKVEARRRRATAAVDYLHDRLFLTIILPCTFMRLQPVSQHLLEWRPFPFERLPLQIQVRIFKLMFVKKRLIHCLSRLDPSNPPEDFPKEDQEGCSQLPTAFHFGTSPCQIVLARKPNDVLKALLVCKRWYFIGVHAFYGRNTFAFSSLGEWHRFCNGIGHARVERLVNVELMWHGALMPPHESGRSRRSLGLSWFTQTKRLRTLVVHIQECAKDRIKRAYEHGRRARSRANNGRKKRVDDNEYPFEASDVKFDPFKVMVQRTAYQPHFREYRSMYTVQGMDYIRQLRGMKWIRFKERDGPEHRQSIRDSSFLRDINFATTPKKPRLALQSELENLTPLTGLEEWVPPTQDMQIIRALYDESPIPDDMVYGSETSESDTRTMDDESTDGDSNSDNDSARMDIDDDDISSGLFVDSGSGSAGDPAERMEVDQDDNDEESDAEGLDGSGQSNNPLLPPGPVSADADSLDLIDLTGDDDDDDAESSLFVHSRLPTPSVKVESSDEAIDLTMADGENSEAEADASNDFDDENRYINEETPPCSDDESDSDVYPSLRSNSEVHSPSSKRPSNADTDSSLDEKRLAKRRRYRGT
ncbi:hypothetical protein F5Y06DRAFT_282809 [Hypoxylon sp. FL0890]|nr:hypothetical protein F5Y06DRAFT_282809 [Hypoxylon sp. FL0890]